MTNSNREISALYLVKDHLDIANALHNSFGDPVDSYWNGSHTWFDAPTIWEDIRVEWRLHPVLGFEMPEASRPEELFELILENKVEVNHYLEGLEVFPVDENELEVEEFKEYVSNKLGITPDYLGFVDHEEIGAMFEHTGGKISIVEALQDQLKN